MTGHGNFHPVVDGESPRPLRVAYAFQSIETDFSETFGAQLHILHTLRGLQQRGHKAFLFLLRSKRRVLFTDDIQAIMNQEPSTKFYADTGRSGSKAFKIFESGIRRLQSMVHFPYLAVFDDYRMYETGRVNLKGFDLIHERYNGPAIGGLLASAKLKIPFILEINADMFEQAEYQGMQIRSLQRNVAIWKTRKIYSSADKIICVSNELREHLIGRWDVPERKAVALPCAADIDAFSRSFDRQQVREKLGLRDEPVVLWVGGYYPWHNLELLVASFSKVIQRVPSARLILVGDGKTRPDVENKIREMDLQRAVVIVGKIDHDKIPEIMSIADVTVSPSTPYFPGHGGTPLKLFEYMAAGKPIVAIAMSQAKAVIEDGYNGILIQPDDENGFTQAVIRLLNNPEERERLGRNAYRRAVEEHSWKRYAERLEAIYYEVLENWRSSKQPT